VCIYLTPGFSNRAVEQPDVAGIYTKYIAIILPVTLLLHFFRRFHRFVCISQQQGHTRLSDALIPSTPFSGMDRTEFQGITDLGL